MAIIAVLGFGVNVTERNLSLAKEVAKLSAKNNHALLCGGISGTFQSAFKTNKQYGGTNILFIESERLPHNIQFYDDIQEFHTSIDKHIAIASTADIAIAIGGGSGTESIIEKLLKRNKKVCIVKNTSGVSDRLIENVYLIHEDQLEEIITQL